MHKKGTGTTPDGLALYRAMIAREGGTMEIKFEPSLSHCIETLAKNEYEKVLNQLLKAKQEDGQLAEKLELLRLFLESADFSQLRGRYEDILSAGRRVEIRLRSTGRTPEFEVGIDSYTP